MTRPDFDSYLICATPRSGSTLLCGLLESSGVAGHPASYFNREGLNRYADDWRIARPRDGHRRSFRSSGANRRQDFERCLWREDLAETLPELISGLAAASNRGDGCGPVSASWSTQIRSPAATRCRGPGGVVGKVTANPFWHPVSRRARRSGSSLRRRADWSACRHDRESRGGLDRRFAAHSIVPASDV